MVFGFIVVVQMTAVSIQVESVLVRQTLVLVSRTFMNPIAAMALIALSEPVYRERNGRGSEMTRKSQARSSNWTFGV